MPFTPFHMGLGLFLKGTLPKHFSLTSFAVTQVIIDLESLYHLVRHEAPVHRIMHTEPVATSIGLGVAVFLSVVQRPIARYLPELRVVRSEVSMWPLLLGGALGGVSHPVLDGLMHSDIRPFLPLSHLNPLLHAVPSSTLHVGCIIAGIAGIGLLAVRESIWERTA